MVYYNRFLAENALKVYSCGGSWQKGKEKDRHGPAMDRTTGRWGVDEGHAGGGGMGWGLDCANQLSHAGTAGTLGDTAGGAESTEPQNSTAVAVAVAAAHQGDMAQSPPSHKTKQRKGTEKWGWVGYSVP